MDTALSKTVVDVNGMATAGAIIEAVTYTGTKYRIEVLSDVPAHGSCVDRFVEINYSPLRSANVKVKQIDRPVDEYEDILFGYDEVLGTIALAQQDGEFIRRSSSVQSCHATT